MIEHHLITWFEDGATDTYGWRCTGCMDECVGFGDPEAATNHGLAEHDKTDTPAEAEAIENATRAVLGLEEP